MLTYSPFKGEKDDTVNRESGGLYIIVNLCHFVNADGTYTKLNLARDSFGRKGNHTTSLTILLKFQIKIKKDKH